MRAALLAALLPVVAAAQTVYSWEDGTGLHFTDDLSSVPKHAKDVRAEAMEVRASPPPATKVAMAELPAPEPAREQPSGPDEATWRKRFIDAHQRVASLHGHLSAAQSATPPRLMCASVPVPLAPPAHAGGAPASLGAPGFAYRERCRPNPEHDRLKAVANQLAADLADAQAELEQLDRDASYQAVPREWRRGF